MYICICVHVCMKLKCICVLMCYSRNAIFYNDKSQFKTTANGSCYHKHCGCHSMLPDDDNNDDNDNALNRAR